MLQQQLQSSKAIAEKDSTDGKTRFNLDPLPSGPTNVNLITISSAGMWPARYYATSPPHQAQAVRVKRRYCKLKNERCRPK
jgi:hypothetical protein